MVKRLLYEIQMIVLHWLHQHYLRPRTVAEFLAWYPACRRARTEAQRLINTYYGQVTTTEEVHHDWDAPWYTTLWIILTLSPSISPQEAVRKDEAFLDAWLASPAYSSRVFVQMRWAR